LACLGLFVAGQGLWLVGSLAGGQGLWCAVWGGYRLFCWYVSAFLLVRIGFFAGTYRLVLACFFA
jgi:hypothetical protein